jgi:transaldolase
MPDTPLHQLSAAGQRAWIDYLSRPFVQDGELQALADRGIKGVTSNPTIFQSAIAEGDRYDEQLREVLKTETDPKEVFLALAIEYGMAPCEDRLPQW